MASAHTLPGYGDPIRRSKSAYPSERSTARRPAQCPVSNDELARIKEEARRMWTPTQRDQTTYGQHFTSKRLDVQCPCRPTSPTRRNNPHPPQVFLVNRLHYIPGYQNPDTTMGKEVYRVDACLPPHLQAARREIREKYRARPSSTSINQYRPRNHFRDYMDPVEAQALEAWVSLADDKDKERVMAMFPGDVPSSQRNLQAVEKRYKEGSSNVPHPMASLHRYLRPAGVSETSELSRVMETIQSNPARQPCRSFYTQPVTNLSDLREADIDATANVRVKRRPLRGDFLIHPEWPPHMYHHRIPGF